MSSFLALRALRPAINRIDLLRRNISSSSPSFSSKKSGSGSFDSPKSSSSASSSSSARIDLNKNVDPPDQIFSHQKSKIPPKVSKDDSSPYKNPEYFQYHEFSYTDMDVIMAKFRLPQPSASAKK